MTFPESMMCMRCLNLTPVRATEERPNLGTSLNTTWAHRDYENVLPGKKNNQKLSTPSMTENRALLLYKQGQQETRQSWRIIQTKSLNTVVFCGFSNKWKKKSKDKKVAISHVKQKTISKDRCHVTLMWPQMNYEL